VSSSALAQGVDDWQTRGTTRGNNARYSGSVRRLGPPHPSDRGSQYASHAFQNKLQEYGMT